MTWVAVAIAGSAVIGAVVANDASSTAASAQRDGANSANATQLAIYNQNRMDQEPYRSAGAGALAQMQNADFQRDFTAADFQADPGYDFRMKQGQKALENSASARGGSHGSATQKAILDYGQGLASSEYQNAYTRFNADRDRRYNRLASLAGTGQTATNQTGADAQNYANQYGANVTGAANATGAAAIAQGNSINNAMGQAVTAGSIYSRGNTGAASTSPQTYNYNSPIAGTQYGGYSSSLDGTIYCDERLKTNVEAVSKEELFEMRKHLRAVKFNYLSPQYGDGDFIGVMAQDLEKSKLGKTLVKTDAEGRKTIDHTRAMMMLLATMAEG